MAAFDDTDPATTALNVEGCVPYIEDSCAAGTLLRGCLPDQAALFGILRQMRNLNLTLVEVRRMTYP